MKHVHHHGRHHIRDKWQKMTPEQRKEFFNKRKEHIDRGRERFERFAKEGFYGRPDFDPFAAKENTPKE
jgi:hypothetical protein